MRGVTMWPSGKWVRGNVMGVSIVHPYQCVSPACVYFSSCDKHNCILQANLATLGYLRFSGIGGSVAYEMLLGRNEKSDSKGDPPFLSLKVTENAVKTAQGSI
mmetsp:Transcript_27397/g.63623  ORF Transcript_27397/g.63623 Transcript_27397/m.63623 type:complete len:103 (+) Transcript_27397:167-475(+)